MEREKWVVGNWKMNGSLSHCYNFLDFFQNLQCKEPRFFSSVNIGLCLPYVFLPFVSSHISSRVLQIGVQDVSEHLSGAFTGEVSASMVAEFGAKLTLIGHSERRQYHSESNELIVKKVQKSLDYGLVPLVCVGETLEERESGNTESIIAEQVEFLFKLPLEALSKLVIAYEPVWAIGTGISASAEEAQKIHHFIRSFLKSHSVSLQSLSLLYGGSVSAKNALSFFSQSDIDGALVGGASLKAESFFDIVRLAAV